MSHINKTTLAALDMGIIFPLLNSNLVKFLLFAICMPLQNFSVKSILFKILKIEKFCLASR